VVGSPPNSPLPKAGELEILRRADTVRNCTWMQTGQAGGLQAATSGGAGIGTIRLRLVDPRDLQGEHPASSTARERPPTPRPAQNYPTSAADLIVHSLRNSLGGGGVGAGAGAGTSVAGPRSSGFLASVVVPQVPSAAADRIAGADPIVIDED